MWIDGEVQERANHSRETRWPWNRDFRFTADNDRVAVMPCMAPAPYDGLTHHHERCDFIEHLVHPVRLERRAVTGLMPAGIGCRCVEHAMEDVRQDSPPRSPQLPGCDPASNNQCEPKQRIPDRGTIATLQQGTHHSTRYLALIPISFRKPPLNSASRIFADEAVVKPFHFDCVGAYRSWHPDLLWLLREFRVRAP
jgi:hypothetical protein